MSRPTADLSGLTDATAGLLAAADALDDAAVAAPSLLPGWTRGHVLAHLARNADALRNVLAARPMYADEAARSAEIDRDADRPAAAHRTDLRESAAALARALDAVPDDGWDATVTLRGGVTDTRARVPLRRWVEVELHHIDLGAGRTVADLPGAFLDRALEYFADRFSGLPGLPPVLLRAEDGRAWRTGRPDEEPQVVAGTPAALVGWLSGRTPGTGLTTAGLLPELPPL
ncbi:maleylpyruvate isomerase family mycothiol-dependent enzyme [Streptomyces sp. DSM 44917]|uniref:Maleylpyruvate isomerase family mycothiol-dependent enzyme n=1 Tax=Streptomyces boetiae TaxID=3075541 RepID=A0ABU2L561_9ACTN|nr:maleylpyruvate isomerase family mycothiol-dependent enzyme [Streptomyces sp. DSM 44917]MDT0306709.1 maleylpyruvate isomerase family mycothiol-dependent enzyme [Streptomyces sp. DSM 44917]